MEWIEPKIENMLLPAYLLIFDSHSPRGSHFFLFMLMKNIEFRS